MFLRNENDTLLTDRDDIVEEWAQYFDQLLNCREPSNPFLFEDKEPNREDYPEPTIEEVAKQIKTLKNHKAPGEDGITGELLKTGAENLVKYIHRLISLIWEKEEIPKEWKTALVYPIHKKGDKQTCNNYRGIALLNVTYKILSYCVLDRIKPWAEEIIGDYQTSYRQNRSMIDQIFILRQVLQKTWEYDKSVHMVFIDYKKAYDSIHRASLIKILEEFGMPSKLISLVGCSISHTDIKVKVGQTLSKTVQVTTGLRQGDAISPVLFNIVLEKVVREAALDKEGVKLGENNIGILAYADDIVLMADSKDKLKEQSKQLINATKRVGLEINAEKTEYMVVQRHEQIGCRNEVLEVENYKFKRVQQFKYLGTLITQQNEIDEHTDEWRILKNKELQDLYQRPSIKENITKRRLKWAGHSWRKTGSLIKIVQENAPKGKRPLGRPRLRWEDRIKEDLEKVRPGLEGVSFR
ncbi:hypothetical protein QTP88_029554 [Uroleucon formosanum]